MSLQRAADLELLTADPDLLEFLEDILRHAFRQVDKAVVLANHDAADVLAFESHFIRNGADDIAGLHAVRATDFHSIRFHVRIVVLAARLAFGNICIASRTRRRRAASLLTIPFGALGANGGSISVYRSSAALPARSSRFMTGNRELLRPPLLSV